MMKCRQTVLCVEQNAVQLIITSLSVQATVVMNISLQLVHVYTHDSPSHEYPVYTVHTLPS